MIAVMHVPHGGEVDIQPSGAHDGAVLVRCSENAVELILHDDLIRQLVAKANAYLDRRAAERTLAMLEGERERRRRAKEKATEATAADVLMVELT